MASSGPSFQYTVSNKALTNEQRQFFEDNGYLYFPKLITDVEADSYNQRFMDIINQKVRGSGSLVKNDLSFLKGEHGGERSLYKFEDFLYDDVFFKYASHPKIVGILSSIIGDSASGVSSMYINKPTENVTKHPMHQDQFYFPFRPSNKICAAWTALEKIDERNGCLFVIPGSHKWGLYPHGYPDGLHKKTYHEAKGFENYEKVYLPMEKGDSVFFHSLLLHGSTPNISEGFRKSITVHYVSNECHIINVRGTLQENIQEEINDRFGKKGINFENKWVRQSRSVFGKPAIWQELESKL